MLVGPAGVFLLPIAVGVAAQQGGFAGALALLGAAHLAILLSAPRLPETGAKGRAASQSPAELSRLAA